MNKGDFVGTCLPHSFKLSSLPNHYSMLTAAEADKGEPGSAIMSFTVPAGLLAQLKADNLVNAERILLYDANCYPTDSDANMKRYLDILQQLSALTVTS